MNLAHNLTATVAEHGSRPAVALDAVTLTYTQVDDASARVAGMLPAKGLAPPSCGA
jgi:long-chain acyl-CoA synthetase